MKKPVAAFPEAATKPVDHKELRLYLRSDDEIILDCADSGSRSGSALGLFSFCPRRDFAVQYDSVLYDVDLDVLRIHLSGSPQGVVDSRFDFRWHNGRLLDANQVAHALDAGQVSDRVFGRGLLILVVDFAFKCDPTAVHFHLDEVGRDPNIPLQRVDCGSGDIFIIANVKSWQVHLHFVGDCLDAGDSFGRMHCRVLLGVALHVAG